MCEHKLHCIMFHFILHFRCAHLTRTRIMMNAVDNKNHILCTRFSPLILPGVQQFNWILWEWVLSQCPRNAAGVCKTWRPWFGKETDAPKGQMHKLTSNALCQLRIGWRLSSSSSSMAWPPARRVQHIAEIHNNNRKNRCHDVQQIFDFHCQQQHQQRFIANCNAANGRWCSSPVQLWTFLYWFIIIAYGYLLLSNENNNTSLLSIYILLNSCCQFMYATIDFYLISIWKWLRKRGASLLSLITPGICM